MNRTLRSNLPDYEVNRIREIVTLMLPEVAGEYQITVESLKDDRHRTAATQARRMLWFVVFDNLDLGYEEVAKIMKPIFPSANKPNVNTAIHYTRKATMDDDDMELKWDIVQAIYMKCKRSLKPTEA
jgi:hypothetical protein